MCRPCGEIRAHDAHWTNAQVVRVNGNVYHTALALRSGARNIPERIDSRDIAVPHLAESAPNTRSTLPRNGVSYTPSADVLAKQPTGIARRSLERFALIAFVLYH